MAAVLIWKASSAGERPFGCGCRWSSARRGCWVMGKEKFYRRSQREQRGKTKLVDDPGRSLMDELFLTQRRKGAKTRSGKDSGFLFLCVFAPLRLCVKDGFSSTQPSL